MNVLPLLENGLFALGQVRFLWVLGAVAVAEVLLLFSGSFSITTFASMVAAAQLLAAGAVLALALRVRTTTTLAPR